MGSDRSSIQVGEFGEFPDFSWNKANGDEAPRMRQELAIETHLMVWPNMSAEDAPPASVCSEECPMGHVKSFTVGLVKSCLLF